MPFNSVATAERVRKILSLRRGVEEKRLMGSLAFMVNGAMCCSVGKGGILMRVSADERDEVLKSPHVKPMKLGRRTMRGFVRVAAEGFRTEAALAKWIERGIEAGKASQQKAR